MQDIKFLNTILLHIQTYKGYQFTFSYKLCSQVC